ncbi:Subtilisin-like protein (Fragment) [Madurella fahalii]|uniref:Subtilisin-like protein n=1 Tax=Madurella fahalii TaxID=1157608 RepID=A0ABQ0G3L9_9PEZI
MELGRSSDQQSLIDAEHGVESDRGVEEWFAIVDGINRMLNEQRVGQFKHIKIATLDTGIDMTNKIFDTPEARAHIKRWEDFLRGEPSRTNAHDMCGHGSHCAGLLRRVAPAGHIYVARVAKNFDLNLYDDVVAKVIERACTPEKEDGWDVDIITMLLGFLLQSEPIEQALRKALHRDKIAFAAASNSGTCKHHLAFPAWSSGVVCINIATNNGTAPLFNPQASFPKKFAILGENMRSAWIAQSPAGNTKYETTKAMAGNSMATPIAAALISLLLEMRKYEGVGVEAILFNASKQLGDYRVIEIRLFQAADRLEIAYWVRRMLREKYGEPPTTPAPRAGPS